MNWTLTIYSKSQKMLGNEYIAFFAQDEGTMKKHNVILLHKMFRLTDQ